MLKYLVCAFSLIAACVYLLTALSVAGTILLPEPNSNAAFLAESHAMTTWAPEPSSNAVLLPASTAQPNLVRSHDNLMEIPDIAAISSSEAHLYVLSSREGLVVFRTAAENPHWLYSSSGLAGRGDRIVTDIRFSYLFGTDGRLTIIEPTSVLGVYSSTHLPSNPNDMVRLSDDLIIADDNHGLRKISLDTPESVDQPPETVFLHDRPILSVAQISGQLLALDDRAQLFLFDLVDGEYAQTGRHQLPAGAEKLHTINNRLYSTSSNGNVHRIRSDGRSDELFRISEGITHLKNWNNYYLIRGESSRIWIARQGLRPTLFREDQSAGNHITTFKDQLWISEYRQLARWLDAGHIATMSQSGESDGASISRTRTPDNQSLRIAPLKNRVVPYPRPLIIPFSIESHHNISDVRFQLKSNIEDINIRGNSLYWQPSLSDVGTHMFTLIANSQDGQTDSTSFEVIIRPFNSPPRFSPFRTLSIPIDEKFSIPFQAVDPDGDDPNLIRYIGVDLPDGVEFNTQTGIFTWTPTRRQAGEHEFQIIATDQFGAASSLDVTINVIDLNRGGS